MHSCLALCCVACQSFLLCLPAVLWLSACLLSLPARRSHLAVPTCLSRLVLSAMRCLLALHSCVSFCLPLRVLLCPPCLFCLHYFALPSCIASPSLSSLPYLPACFPWPTLPFLPPLIWFACLSGLLSYAASLRGFSALHCITLG